PYYVGTFLEMTLEPLRNVCQNSSKPIFQTEMGNLVPLKARRCQIPWSWLRSHPTWMLRTKLKSFGKSSKCS
ncbi:mCG146254, partial [Mus musculus]